MRTLLYIVLFFVAFILSIVFSVDANQSNYYSDKIWLTENMDLNTQDIDKLSLDLGPGDIIIKGVSNSQTIEMVARFGGDEIDPSQYELKLEKQGNNANLVAMMLPNSHGNTYIDIELLVPANLLIKMNDRSGDINITQMQNGVSIEDKSGDILLRDIDGIVKIEDKSGDIRLNDIGDDIDITDKSGDISVLDVMGKLNIIDSSGDIETTQVNKDVFIRDSSGDIYVTSTNGTVDITDSNGDVEVTDAADFVINKMGKGDINSKGIKSDR